jgi:hypothetical protein
MIEIVKNRLVEQFVAHAAVEGLADAVLHRLAGRDEVPVDAGGLRPGKHGVGGELRAVACWEWCAGEGYGRLRSSRLRSRWP